MEQEKLTFRPNLKMISQLFRFPYGTFQNISWVSLERIPVWPVNIANEPCHLSPLRPPWENLPCAKIRIKIHIRFLNPHKPFYRRAVKHTLIVQCLFQLAGCNRHIFQIPKHIGKLQPDKFYILFPYQIHDIFPCIISLHLNNYAPFKILKPFTQYAQSPCMELCN